MPDPKEQMKSEGQLTLIERQLLCDIILNAESKPDIVLEVGTWLGTGSTVHILRALEKNNGGHLWGIEADRSIYEQMIANIRAVAPTAVERFTPLFGYSQDIIPTWLAEQDPQFRIDLAFLDGGNNPMEQITEFNLIDRYIPVGGTLVTHDAKLRKGKWLVPYLSALDNWESKLHDVSEEGLFIARKTGISPSPLSLRRAGSKLRRLRMQPAELAAAVLPANLCRVVLNAIPEKLRRQIAEGRSA
jgi:predicted O-methyltransferase YrrM